jgi:hypothetical protein
MALTARALSSITAGFSGLSLERTGRSAALKSYCGLRATPVVVDRFGSSGLRQNRQVCPSLLSLSFPCRYGREAMPQCYPAGKAVSR